MRGRTLWCAVLLLSAYALASCATNQHRPKSVVRSVVSRWARMFLPIGLPSKPALAIVGEEVWVLMERRTPNGVRCSLHRVDLAKEPLQLETITIFQERLCDRKALRARDDQSLWVQHAGKHYHVQDGRMGEPLEGPAPKGPSNKEKRAAAQARWSKYRPAGVGPLYSLDTSAGPVVGLRCFSPGRFGWICTGPYVVPVDGSDEPITEIKGGRVYQFKAVPGKVVFVNYAGGTPQHPKDNAIEVRVAPLKPPPGGGHPRSKCLALVEGIEGAVTANEDLAVVITTWRLVVIPLRVPISDLPETCPGPSIGT